MQKENVDALVFVGSAYAGHKGGIRYVIDYNPAYRSAYCVLPRTGNPVLILPGGEGSRQKERCRYGN